MIVLDTDVFIDCLRGYPPALTWLGSIGDAPLAVPGLVAMELLQGCRNQREQLRLETRLLSFRHLWPDTEACEAAWNTYREFHLSHRLGFVDALVAHTARSHGLPIHTFNTQHYALVAGLEIRQPYARLSQA